MNVSLLYKYIPNGLTIGKKEYLTGLFVLLISLVSAQLTVNNSAPYDDVQYLVDNVLFESGVEISNIQYFGSSGAIGYFDGTSSNLGVDSGLVLCTGDISMLPGPNSSTLTTVNAFGCTCLGDPDSLLDTLAGYPTLDAAILQFDFIPYGDSIVLTYVFGSEEYPEYVLFGLWNDVMAIFITGPNPDGGTYNNQNIALIPNTTLPISIVTVNEWVNSPYFVINEIDSAPPPAGLTIELDGFTTPLTASANVVCGATYTLKIGIADVNDNQLESALFLEAKSFGAVSPAALSANTTYYTSASDSSLLEGCDYADIELIRTGSILDSLQVSVTYTGAALNGIDYDTLPDTIVFAAGSSSYTLLLNPILDSLIEVDENLTIAFTAVLNDSLDSICFPFPNASVDLIIRNRAQLELTVPTDIFLTCPGDTAFIYAAMTGVIGDAVFSWSTGLSDSGNVDTSSFFDAPSTTTVYIVTASDSCSTQTLSDTITVFVPNFPPLEMNLDDTTVCLGGSLIITPAVTGGNGEYSYNWSTGDTASSLYLTPEADSVYSVVVTDACGATITAQSLVGINPQPIADFSFTVTESSEAILTNTSTGGVTYFWDFGDGSSSSVENPTHAYSQSGLHAITLYVYNQYNCLDSVSYTVDIITKLQFYVPNVLDLNSLNQDNNRLYVFGEGIETLSFSIYDRWGEIVYQTSDASTSLRGDGLCCAYGEGWDGNYSNAEKTLNTSVFAYIVTGTFINGEEFMESGSITLIK